MLFSHAIMTYLVGKYSKSDALYPKDLNKRAMVDQRLYFNSSVLSVRTKDAVVCFLNLIYLLFIARLHQNKK